MDDVFEVAHGITGLDTHMAGKTGLTSGYLVESFAPTLVETGPGTSADAVTRALHRLGVDPDDLAHIVVTHIHLDHAGGVGEIAARFPKAMVWVHPVGAPHLADPTRLNASATRVYGAERLAELFGRMHAVPADRIRALEDGGEIDLGSRRLTALHTPGHASHHLALQDSSTGAVFTGDAVGVHLPQVPVLRPAAPPPEFDVELAIASIERIRSHARGTLLFSHFGALSAVEETCAIAIERIREWADIVRLARLRTQDLGEIAQALRRATAADYEHVSDSDQARFELLGVFDLNAAGLSRYWKKREDAGLN
jgi:glyoxylase-like metal-dependent hydrolase (beta-lactamase superfamily II)